MSTSSHALVSTRTSGRAAPLAPSAGPAGLLAAVARAWRLRRAVRELAELDDHMLRDIGLDRGEIGRAVRAGRGVAAA